SGELLAAIRSVHEGGIYLDPMMTRKLLAEKLKRDTPEGVNELSERELEVLRLIADGMTAPEIAEKLVISVNTVQTHRLHIMRKLNLHNRAELFKYAINKGLIQSETL
ncbi:MAG: response regulator transcription factor, partial [Chloroflexi bacterium]|nr:response regulator transcription factor [Chloroflexota bacterium]